MAVDMQFRPVGVRPLLLLRRRHAYPEQVGIGSVNGLDYGAVVVGRELRLVRRRVCSHLQTGVHLGAALADKGEHLLRTAHKHHALLLPSPAEAFG